MKHAFNAPLSTGSRSILDEKDIEPAPSGSFSEITNFDFAIYSVIDDLDYMAQLSAVRALLERHKQHDENLEHRMKDIAELAKRTSGLANERVIDDWGEHFYMSIFQDAAHSMAAVGMLAPLTEAIFSRSFAGLRRLLENDTHGLSLHPRWQWSTEQQWDCHYVYVKNGRREKRLVEGILQLSDAIGLSPYLPPTLQPTLQALFEYRNKMFHHGFEWPTSVRRDFNNRKTIWPKDWFSAASSDNEPWIFYLTAMFITHCLNTIDDIVSGIGAFARTKLSLRDHSF
jgi:hypothetical protein